MITMREIRITLRKSEILGTALGNLRLIGQGRDGAEGETSEHVALLQSGDLPEDMSQLAGAMKSAWRLLLRAVSEWVRDGMPQSDNKPMSPRGMLEVTLQMPGNYGSVATDLIADAMHRYLCDRITGEWLQRVSLDLAAPWLEKGADDLADLRAALWSRLRPARPQTEPVPPTWHEKAPKREIIDSEETDGEEQ